MNNPSVLWKYFPKSVVLCVHAQIWPIHTHTHTHTHTHARTRTHRPRHSTTCSSDSIISPIIALNFQHHQVCRVGAKVPQGLGKCSCCSSLRLSVCVFENGGFITTPEGDIGRTQGRFHGKCISSDNFIVYFLYRSIA